jgi:hypothetical protein
LNYSILKTFLRLSAHSGAASGEEDAELTHSDTLDDLEYSRPADHKDEKSHQPRSNWIFLFSLSS